MFKLKKYFYIVLSVGVAFPAYAYLFTRPSQEKLMALEKLLRASTPLFEAPDSQKLVYLEKLLRANAHEGPYHTQQPSHNNDWSNNAQGQQQNGGNVNTAQNYSAALAGNASTPTSTAVTTSTTIKPPASSFTPSALTSTPSAQTPPVIPPPAPQPPIPTTAPSPAAAPPSPDGWALFEKFVDTAGKVVGAIEA